MTGRRAAAALLVTALALPAAAHAQAAAAGRLVGRLAAAPDASRDVREGLHQVQVTPGTLVEISAGSTSFDTVLRIVLPTGDTLVNDDHGTGTDSRLTFPVPEGIDAVDVRVTAFDALGAGDYVLSVRSLGAVDREVREGKLSTASRLTPKNVPFDVHTFRLEQPHALSVTLAASDFDPFLVLVAPDGERYTNDDGQGLDAAIDVRRASPGVWTAYATSAAPSASGAYRLSVLKTRVEAEGATYLEGRLEEGDSLSLRGELYDRHEVALEGSGPVAVVLESHDFDVFLTVRLPDGRRFSSDDAPSRGSMRYTARVEIPEPSRSLEVFVTSFAAGQMGRYSLTVEPLSLPGPPR